MPEEFLALEKIKKTYSANLIINLLTNLMLYNTLIARKDLQEEGIMNPVRSMLENTVPISMFNKGMAGKIFESVRQSGTKVVMKNNVAECVLLSPEEYIAIIDELEDMYLMAEARSRMENFNVDKLISREEFDRRFGITEEDIKDFEGVDFE